MALLDPKRGKHAPYGSLRITGAGGDPAALIRTE